MHTGRPNNFLRARLDLDSGYLSRLLRALEADGLVTVGGSLADQRVRTARLTRKGRKERDRTRLVDAMTEVERLLTAALVEIEVVDPATTMPGSASRSTSPSSIVVSMRATTPA